MPEQNVLMEAFRSTKYQLGGHGKRDIQVLKDVLAAVDGQLDIDVYGKGDIIEDFQTQMAEFLGKEAAVFFPSGTMAQQIALRIWCDEKGSRTVAYHPLCHLEIHEEDGLKRLHQIQPVLLADKSRLITLDDVRNMPEEVACLLIELPQREIGGQLPDYETLEAISAYCRERDIKLHLDGARLFEILPYYNKSAAEICQLFDSVYVSFYKGIGGIAGAILAGNTDFIKESIPWKRRHGGDLVSLYPYILSAKYYFDRRINKMAAYYESAMELAEHFNRCPGVSTRPAVPVSNMFHVHFAVPKDTMEAIFVEMNRETGIGFTGYVREVSEHESYFEMTLGDQYSLIPKANLKEAFDLFAAKMSAITG